MKYILKAWAWVLWRLGFKIQALTVGFWHAKAEYQSRAMKAKREGKEGEFTRLKEEFTPQVAAHMERFTFHSSQELIEKAVIYQLAVPERPPSGQTNEYWRPGTFGPLLTERGFEVLRPRIRAEEKERRDVNLARTGYIGAVTGLVGTLIGLVSALKH